MEHMWRAIYNFKKSRGLLDEASDLTWASEVYMIREYMRNLVSNVA